MFLEFYHLAFEITFIVLAFIFVISSIDELIIIACYVALQFFKIFSFNKKHNKLKTEVLKNEEQKPAAIMIACWDESEIIYDNLKKACENIQYKNYKIFVGTYPNDKETQAAVDKACSECPHVFNIVVDHNGPTTKPDNLNSIWKGIQKYEQENNTKFEIFAIHDAEDNIPAFGLSVFNHLIPRKSVVQLPVLPKKVRWRNFVEATYADEFAFNHSITLRTREWLAHSIPTAGTGCAFSREFMYFADKTNDQKGPLGLETLTEDYELSLVNAQFEGEEIFFDSLLVTDNKDDKLIDHIPAVRSNFPRTLKKAIIQRSRWILGITLQGTKHLGWRGNFSFRYMLFRDRKALITNIINLIGTAYLLLFLLDMFVFKEIRIEKFSLLDKKVINYAIYFNLASMFILIGIRIISVSVIYGVVHGVLSVPRILFGNIINGIASLRALKIYRSTMKKNELPRWEKTAHDKGEA